MRRCRCRWFAVSSSAASWSTIGYDAAFDVQETPDRLRVALESRDGITRVAVAGTVVPRLPAASVFGSVAEASRFFELGSRGYSPSNRQGSLQGLELRTQSWDVVPLEVSELRSSFFESKESFPEGSTEFDCALLMRDIPHEWHALRSIGSRNDAA
jgi:hypothetical protein